MGHLAGRLSCYSTSLAKAARAHIVTRYTIPSDSCVLLAPEHDRTPTMTSFRLFTQKLEGQRMREYSAWSLFYMANDFGFELPVARLSIKVIRAVADQKPVARSHSS
jgi:hypothetical protein